MGQLVSSNKAYSVFCISKTIITVNKWSHFIPRNFKLEQPLLTPAYMQVTIHNKNNSTRENGCLYQPINKQPVQPNIHAKGKKTHRTQASNI